MQVFGNATDFSPETSSGSKIVRRIAHQHTVRINKRSYNLPKQIAGYKGLKRIEPDEKSTGYKGLRKRSGEDCERIREKIGKDKIKPIT